PRPALATAKTKLPDDIRTDSYEDMRDGVRAYFAVPVADRKDTEVQRPRKEWDIYRAINPASLPGYNSLMTDWHIAKTDPEALFILLDLYATLPNDFDSANDRWKALAKQHDWKITP